MRDCEKIHPHGGMHLMANRSRKSPEPSRRKVVKIIMKSNILQVFGFADDVARINQQWNLELYTRRLNSFPIESSPQTLSQCC